MSRAVTMTLQSYAHVFWFFCCSVIGCTNHELELMTRSSFIVSRAIAGQVNLQQQPQRKDLLTLFLRRAYIYAQCMGCILLRIAHCVVTYKGLPRHCWNRCLTFCLLVQAHSHPHALLTDFRFGRCSWQ